MKVTATSKVAVTFRFYLFRVPVRIFLYGLKYSSA